MLLSESDAAHLISIVNKLIEEGWEEEIQRLRHCKEFLKHPAVWQTKSLTDRSKFIPLDHRKEAPKTCSLDKYQTEDRRIHGGKEG